MPPETLDFEEPVAALLKEIDALSLLPHTEARDRQIESLLMFEKRHRNGTAVEE